MLLRELADGGVAARERVRQAARDADDLEVTFPTYAALTAWGREGLDLVARIALDGQTVKSKSAALTLFSYLSATGEVPAQKGLVWIPQNLADFVNHKIDQNSIKSAARNALRNLICQRRSKNRPLGRSKSRPAAALS